MGVPPGKGFGLNSDLLRALQECAPIPTEILRPSRPHPSELLLAFASHGQQPPPATSGYPGLLMTARQQI